MSSVATTPSTGDVEELRRRTRSFIHDAVIPAEPGPGERLPQSERDRLQAAAKEAGVFAPHVATDYGGLGLPLEHWSPVFQEAGYSPIGPSILNCMAPDEGNMHLLELIATDAQKKRYLVPLATAAARSC